MDTFNLDQLTEDELKFLIISIVGFIVGIWMFFQGFEERKKHKLIQNTPTSKVRSVAVGLAELHGKAVILGKALISPFSNKPCVFYRYQVQEYRRSRRHSYWHTIKSGITREFFNCEDETGSFPIKPMGAELHLVTDQKHECGVFSSTNRAEFDQGLARVGVNPKGFLGFKRPLRCLETYIEPGDDIYVLGTVHKPLREECDQPLCLGWGKEHLFIISDKSEKELIGSLGWEVVGLFYGGPVLSLGCLAIIIFYCLPMK